jgi:hemerythrin superfamily protein
MSIEEQIKREHSIFRETLTRLSNSTVEDAGERRRSLIDFTARLMDHEDAEEKTLYLAMREDEKLNDLALEGVEQHKIIQVLLENLEVVDVEDELWLPKMRAAKGILESHMLVEEKLLLPTARDILGEEAMELLSTRYEALQPPMEIRAGQASS